MLKEFLDTNLKAAFQNQLKDAYKPFVLKRTTNTRDKQTDQTDQNVITVETFNSSGVFGKFNSEEVDGSNILYTDERLLILQSQLSTRPEIGDVINNKRVSSVGKDPADVTWVLGLRSTNGLE